MRWGRVIVAAALSEVGVTAVIFVAALAYTAMSGTRLADVGEEVGYYVAAPAALVMTLLAVLWAARGLATGFIRHGVAVGILAVVLTLGFVFGARPEHRLMYAISFALRIVGGYAGGLFAQGMFNARAARSAQLGQSA
jgi:hypothetical protein